MNRLAYELDAGQRRVFDRYTRFLGALPQTFSIIALVFDRRKNSGHQQTFLAKDLRVNNAVFNERYLREFWGRTEQTQRLCNAYIEDLATFTRESLDIARQTSRNEPISQIDFKLYSLSKSRTWMLFPPRNVQDLVHELYLRFDDLSAAIRQLKYTIREVHEESFGLKSVFTQAMDHRSCQCHPQPTVVQELFGQTSTTPVWDIAYSSTQASVRAAEYKADIATLFSGFAAVAVQMSLFIEAMQQRMEDASVELLRARDATLLRELNFKLGGVMEGAQACKAMMNQLETWLRK
jgi:hypothetical protein